MGDLLIGTASGAIVFAAGYALGFCHATMAAIRINSKGKEPRNG